MNIDLFLGEKRWEILKIISASPSSPIEIAEKLSTTVSYVSQQLKLLEVGGFVKKTKTGFAEKGKPRSVYSVSKELVQLSILTEGIAEKKVVYLSNNNRAIMNILLIKNSEFHFPFIKLYCKLDESISKVNGIFLKMGVSPEMIIFSDSKELKTKINSFVSNSKLELNYSFVSEAALSKLSSDLLVALHDPNDVLKEIELKGGSK